MKSLSVLERRIEDLEQVRGPNNWPEIRLAIVETLDSYPEAKSFLSSKLSEDRQGRSWPELKEFILRTLQEFPEARQKIIAAVDEAEE